MKDRMLGTLIAGAITAALTTNASAAVTNTFTWNGPVNGVWNAANWILATDPDNDSIAYPNETGATGDGAVINANATILLGTSNIFAEQLDITGGTVSINSTTNKQFTLGSGAGRGLFLRTAAGDATLGSNVELRFSTRFTIESGRILTLNGSGSSSSGTPGVPVHEKYGAGTVDSGIDGTVGVAKNRWTVAEGTLNLLSTGQVNAGNGAFSGSNTLAQSVIVDVLSGATFTGTGTANLRYGSTPTLDDQADWLEVKAGGTLNISSMVLNLVPVFDVGNLLENDDVFTLVKYNVGGASTLTTNGLTGHFASVIGLPTDDWVVVNDAVNNRIVLQFIPEPASLALLGLGAFLLAPARRRTPQI